MKIAEVTLVYEVSTEGSEELKAAIRALIASHDGRVTADKSWVMSPELSELGLKTQLNMALTSVELDTVDSLRGRTEEQLLALKGKVGYASLRKIVLALAKRNLVLKGVDIAVPDLVEHLELTVQAYEKLKKAGFPSISGITEADLVELQKVLPSAYLGLRRALELLGLSWSPLRPERVLGDLDLLADIQEMLDEAGVSMTTPVAQLTEAGLKNQLASVVSPQFMDGTLGRIRQTLAQYGLQLPAVV